MLARKDQNWTIASRNNQPANSDEVRRLIDTLKNQQVTKFVADTASDLPKYGLDQPQLRLTFSSFASENTAESAAGEHPFLTLSFGKIEGTKSIARVGEEPFIVAVHRRFSTRSGPIRCAGRSCRSSSSSPNEIHRVSRVIDQEESVVRSGPKEWKWIEGKRAD